MTKAHTVAGIYVERDNALLLLARVQQGSSEGPKYVAHKDVFWHPKKPEEARRGLRHLLEIVRSHKSQPSSLGIASYGPFNSLDPFTRKYGCISKLHAHPPLNGLNIFNLVTSVLGGQWGHNPEGASRLTIQTDAAACAVGEALARRPEDIENVTKAIHKRIERESFPEAFKRNAIAKAIERLEDRNLAFIICGKGIGLGLVRGTKIVSSALHPEVGLLPPRIMHNDPLKPDGEAKPKDELEITTDYSSSVAELASDEAMASRYCKMHGLTEVRMRDVQACTDQDFWDFRAHYLAQACLACTVVAPPHVIVLGSKIDPRDDLTQRTLHYLREFLRQRGKDKQPLIDYTDLRLKGYISALTPHENFPLPTNLATTGAIGMCHTAARTLEEK